MIGIGSLVRCVKPGNSYGPDCKVGNIFVVLDLDKDFLGTPQGEMRLIFYCHPYVDIKNRWNCVSARASRFVEVASDNDVFMHEITDVLEYDTIIADF